MDVADGVFQFSSSLWCQYVLMARGEGGNLNHFNLRQLPDQPTRPTQWVVPTHHYNLQDLDITFNPLVYQNFRIKIYYLQDLTGTDEDRQGHTSRTDDRPTWFFLQDRQHRHTWHTINNWDRTVSQCLQYFIFCILCVFENHNFPTSWKVQSDLNYLSRWLMTACISRYRHYLHVARYVVGVRCPGVVRLYLLRHTLR